VIISIAELFIYAKSSLIATVVPQIILNLSYSGDIDRKYLAETVSRRDADAEPRIHAGYGLWQ
jgi:hypothetical protein